MSSDVQVSLNSCVQMSTNESLLISLSHNRRHQLPKQAVGNLPRSGKCLSAKWCDASKRLCRENDWKAARELKILQRLKFWGMVTFLSIFVFFCRQISKLAKNWICNFSSTKFLARLQLSLEQKWPKRAVACKEKRLLCAFCLTYSMEEPGNVHLDSEGEGSLTGLSPCPYRFTF